ncbi:MAG: hypothetical protein P4L84_20935 [Isosphaeraceae bacterium]|nr:hypothetical protein [Isosphaeraceae bacterium]
MDPIEAFCSELLNDGRVVLRDRPVSGDRVSPGAIAVLSRAFDAERRTVAGPPIAFDSTVAYEAAELARQACWSAVYYDEPAAALRPRFAMKHRPTSASHHLSADLTFRYLPQVLRRARALATSDPLVTFLSDVLRQWPLSGVLSDVREPPAGPLDFGGHEGLMLLYAERLVRHERAAWVPPARAGEYAELIYQECGRALPPPRAEVLSDV